MRETFFRLSMEMAVTRAVMVIALLIVPGVIAQEGR